jgi:hypothetical protein
MRKEILLQGGQTNFREIKRIREDGETKKQRNHSLYNRNQNEGQIGRGRGRSQFPNHKERTAQGRGKGK